MLVDTGAAVSMISATKTDNDFKDWPICEWKMLEGFNGKSSSVPFTEPVKCQLGEMACSASFGIQQLDGTGILGVDILKRLGAAIDLPNRVILSQGEEAEPYEVAASYRVAAVKAPNEITLPDWDPEISTTAQRHLAAFAVNKLQCRKTKRVARIRGPDPKPLKQY